MNWIEELQHDIKTISTNDKELKKFGALIGSICVVAASLAHWNQWFDETILFIFLAAGFALLIMGLVLPRYLKIIYILWMSIALVIGSIISRIILFILFFVILTPISILARIFKKTFTLKYKDSQLQSYWIKRDKSKEINYEQMH